MCLSFKWNALCGLGGVKWVVKLIKEYCDLCYSNQLLVQGCWFMLFTTVFSIFSSPYLVRGLMWYHQLQYMVQIHTLYGIHFISHIGIQCIQKKNQPFWEKLEKIRYSNAVMIVMFLLLWTCIPRAQSQNNMSWPSCRLLPFWASKLIIQIACWSTTKQVSFNNHH